MIRASIYGRLGADPINRTTKNGNAMACANLAVNAGREEEETVWFSVVAFGNLGKALMGHVKGDLLAAMGPLYKSRYTDRNGVEKGSWSLTAESIVSARTVRPGGGNKKKPEPAPAPADDTTDAGQPFDDEISF